MRLFLDSSLDTCTYFGFGPGESYVDKKEGCYRDRFTSRIKDMFENYIRPQENGSHCGTEYLSLTDGHTSLRISSENPSVFRLWNIRGKSWQRRHITFNWKKQAVRCFIWIMP